jgi:uncharacterized membrane protein YeiH
MFAAAVDATTDLDVPLWVEAIAIGAGAIYGAIRAVTDKLSYTGVVALAVAMGVGGGLIRDILVQQGPPIALRDGNYLIICLVAGAIGFVLVEYLDRVNPVLLTVDALAIGMYTVLGADKAQQAGLSALGVIVVAILAGTGGSVLADLATGKPPHLFQVGPVLGVGAAAGAMVYVAGTAWIDNRSLWLVVAVVIATGLRMGSLWRGWLVPVADPTVLRRPFFRRGDDG